MPAAAPRIDPRLRRLARKLAGRRPVTADIHRAVGQYASGLSLPRPSYQQVRLIVNDARLRSAARRAAAELVLDVELGRRPPKDILLLLRE